MAAKKSMREQGFEDPVEMAGIMMLFILGVVTFPTSRILRFFGVEGAWLVLADGAERLAFTAMMLHFIRGFGFRIIPPKTHITDILFVLPAFIVAVNNFPFITYFSGKLEVVGGALEWAALAVYCLGVGIFEEVSFRGVIMPLCLIKFRNKKYPLLTTLLVSGAVFGLTHLVNIFGGASIGGTLFQVCYTFLIGAMCGVVALKTGNVLIAAAVHVIYDFGGMLFSEFEGYGEPIWLVGKGDVWGSVWPPSAQIVFTAVIGVACGIALLFAALSLEKKKEPAFNMLGERPYPGEVTAA